MKVRSGTTRIVFIFAASVVKIPRIPVVLFFKRLLLHYRKRNVRETIVRLDIDSTFLINFFLAGFIANRLEYQYSKNNPDKEGIIPINRMYFGCILVQPRGEEIRSTDSRWKYFYTSLLRKQVPHTADVWRPENYSYWKNGIYLHDYGSPATVLYLDTV